MVNPTVALHAAREDIETHRAQVRRLIMNANPEYVKHIDVDDTFCGHVGSKVVGGKAYWKVGDVRARLSSRLLTPPCHLAGMLHGPDRDGGQWA